MGKRAVDLVLGLLALVVTAPVLLLAMLWVRLDSPGPILFRQERVGRHGRLFRIHKLRTMRVADSQSAGPAITGHADRRITRAGQWLRRYRIDELPQLIDVLRGDMSLVGPRPEVPRYVEMFRDDYAEILQVRPGITDLASITYRDEATVLGQAADPEATYVQRVLPAK